MSEELPDRWRLTRALGNSPRFWLAIEIAALAIVLFCGDRLTLTQFPDSPTYTILVDAPLAEALKATRTLGYPLILKAVRLFSPFYEWLPWVQLAMFCAAVFLMDSALRRWGASPWQALLADSGLLWAGYTMNDLFACLLSDMPALSAAIAVASLLLMVVAAPGRVWPWIGLTLGVALTCQIRPAYLFLVVLVPLAGLLLRRVRVEHGDPAWPWPWFAGSLAGAAAVPLLGFCLLRWAAVGEFGLVSFGGYNAIGIAVELLNRPTIDRHLPEHLRPLALEILERRESLPFPRAYADGVRIDRYRVFAETNDANIWLAAIPVISARCDHDNIQVNRICNELASSVLAARKLDYAKHLAISFVRGVKRGVRHLARALLVVALVLFVRRRIKMRRRPLPSEEPLWMADRGAASALGIVALLFLVGKMALVVAVQNPITRYAFPAAALVSPWVFLWVGRECAWAAVLARAAVRKASPRPADQTSTAPRARATVERRSQTIDVS